MVAQMGSGWWRLAALGLKSDGVSVVEWVKEVVREVGLVGIENEDMNGDGYGRHEEWPWVHKSYVHG